MFWLDAVSQYRANGNPAGLLAALKKNQLTPDLLPVLTAALDCEQLLRERIAASPTAKQLQASENVCASQRVVGGALDTPESRENMRLWGLHRDAQLAEKQVRGLHMYFPQLFGTDYQIDKPLHSGQLLPIDVANALRPLGIDQYRHAWSLHGKPEPTPEERPQRRRLSAMLNQQ